jgi:hypothetical protein
VIGARAGSCVTDPTPPNRCGSLWGFLWLRNSGKKSVLRIQIIFMRIRIRIRPLKNPDADSHFVNFVSRYFCLKMAYKPIIRNSGKKTSSNPLPVTKEVGLSGLCQHCFLISYSRKNIPFGSTFFNKYKIKFSDPDFSAIIISVAEPHHF